MLAESDYCRQVRLAEVGESGQQRLAAAAVRVAAGEGALEELMYLERAGLGAVSIDATSVPCPFPHAAALRHGACRELGRGAWGALRSIVDLLEIEP